MKMGKIKTTVLAVVLMVSASQAVVLFDNGGVNDVDWNTGEDVEIKNDAFFDNPTTVNFLLGGLWAGTTDVYGSSLLNINGGIIDFWLNANDDAQITVNDGEVSRLHSFSSSQITINNGRVSNGHFDSNSQITVNDGILSSIYCYDAPQVFISGGLIYNLNVLDNSQVSVSGGVFEKTFYIGESGGDVDTSTMEFIGTDFAINGTPVGPGEFTNGGTGEIHGTLTGILASGELLDRDFWIYDDSKLILSAPALLPGDANRDGQVSAGDYASVQANFGDTGDPGIPGDANLDGQVSAGDYASVQANFGNISAVPEPTCLLLIGGGLLLARKQR